MENDSPLQKGRWRIRGAGALQQRKQNDRGLVYFWALGIALALAMIIVGCGGGAESSTPVSRAGANSRSAPLQGKPMSRKYRSGDGTKNSVKTST